MTETSGVQPDRTPTTTGAIRGLIVVFGGPILLVLWAVSGIVAVLTGVSVRRLPGGRIGRLVVGVGALLPVGYFGLVRSWMEGWGATRDERVIALPGDELTPDAAFKVTRAVTIDAPVDQVWPWIAQLGQDRGGFYSYEWLENLAGCEIRNADRIYPEWQHRAIGDLLYLHPAVGLRVARFEPGRTLVVDPWGGFTVVPLPGGKTRLFARAAVAKGFVAWLVYVLLLDIPFFIMERKMLLSIKELAERSGKPA